MSSGFALACFGMPMVAAGRLAVDGSKLTYNGSPIFLSGANQPWWVGEGITPVLVIYTYRVYVCVWCVCGVCVLTDWLMADGSFGNTRRVNAADAAVDRCSGPQSFISVSVLRSVSPC